MHFTPTYLVTSANAKDDMYHSILSTPLYTNNKVDSTSFSFFIYFLFYMSISSTYIYIYIYKLKEGLREGLFLDLEFHDIHTYIYIYIDIT